MRIDDVSCPIGQDDFSKTGHLLYRFGLSLFFLQNQFLLLRDMRNRGHPRSRRNIPEGGSVRVGRFVFSPAHGVTLGAKALGQCKPVAGLADLLRVTAPRWNRKDDQCCHRLWFVPI